MSDYDILTRCDCFVENFPVCAPTPNSYINNLRFWCSSYKFHFRYEHKEKFVSHFFLTNFVTNIINITSYFRREVELLNDIVNCPITEPRILTETVKEFLLVLMRIPTLEKVPIEQLNYTLHLFSQILHLWDMFIFQNGLDKFVWENKKQEKRLRNKKHSINFILATLAYFWATNKISK